MTWFVLNDPSLPECCDFICWMPTCKPEQGTITICQSRGCGRFQIHGLYLIVNWGSQQNDSKQITQSGMTTQFFGVRSDIVEEELAFLLDGILNVQTAIDIGLCLGKLRMRFHHQQCEAYWSQRAPCISGVEGNWFEIFYVAIDLAFKTPNPALSQEISVPAKIYPMGVTSYFLEDWTLGKLTVSGISQTFLLSDFQMSKRSQQSKEPESKPPTTRGH